MSVPPVVQESLTLSEPRVWNVFTTWHRVTSPSPQRSSVLCISCLSYAVFQYPKEKCVETCSTECTTRSLLCHVGPTGSHTVPVSRQSYLSQVTLSSHTHSAVRYINYWVSFSGSHRLNLGVVIHETPTKNNGVLCLNADVFVVTFFFFF